MVNCSSVLKASSELTDCPCRFCSAKKRERDQPSSAATEQIQLSSDLKFSLSILGLGHSVSVSPCIFAGDASTGGVHLRAIGPTQPFWTFVLPSTVGADFWALPLVHFSFIVPDSPNTAGKIRVGGFFLILMQKISQYFPTSLLVEWHLTADFRH